MAIDFGAILFESACRIVERALSKKVSETGTNFLTQRRIKARLEDAIAKVIEPLVPYLESERISDERKLLLLNVCETELQRITDDPAQFFAASLDGQKLFDKKYATDGLPEAIVQEELSDLYAAIFPRIANLICAYPPALEKWRTEGYKEEFRRFDEITYRLSAIAESITEFNDKGGAQVDALQQRLRHSLKQRVQFSLDLTGLRGDRPDAVPLEQCFVVPDLLFLHAVGRKRPVRHAPYQHEPVAEENIPSTFSPGTRKILIGAPGSGKSSFCQWLQLVHLGNTNQTLTFTIRLRELVKETALPSYLEIIKAASGTHLKDEITASTASQWINNGNILFLFDGLDEVPNALRDGVVSWIRDLACTNSRIGLAITSRPLTTGQLNTLEGWELWEIRPFDKPRVINYINKWYAHAPLLQHAKRDVDAEQLASVWLEDESLAPLAGSPLMLATLLMVHHLDGALPRGRSKVYERYVDGMLGLWDSRWGIAASIELTTQEKKRLLTEIALHLHFQSTEVIDDSQIISVVAPLIAKHQLRFDATLVLDHLRERSGLLVGPGMWSFVHKSVSEFLVACSVIDGDLIDSSGERIDRLRLFKERFDDRWNTVIFFWAGLASPGDLQSFIVEIIKSGTGRDFTLGVGLIADQALAHRLPKAWRAHQLQQLVRIPPAREETQSTALVTNPCVDSDITCWRLTYATSRSVSSDFFSLRWRELWTIAAEADMSWRDVKHCHEAHRDSLWINYLKSATEIGQVEELLSDATAWLTDIERLTVAYSWGLPTSGNTSRSIGPKDYTFAFIGKFPEIRSRAPFFILDDLARSTDATQIEELVPILEAIDVDELDRNWLNNCDNFEDMGEETVTELLTTCREHLRQLASVTPAVVRAMNYLEALTASQQELIR